MFSTLLSDIFAWDSSPDLDSFLSGLNSVGSSEYPKTRFLGSVVLHLSLQLFFFSFIFSRPWIWCGSGPTKEPKARLEVAEQPLLSLSMFSSLHFTEHTKGKPMFQWEERHRVIVQVEDTFSCSFPVILNSARVSLILMDADVFRCHGYVLLCCCGSDWSQLWLQPTFCYSY